MEPRYQPYAQSVVRYGVALVFLLFGVWQLVDPSSWLGYVPSYVPFNPTIAVYMNGVIDMVLGIVLTIGFLTRVSAILAALHLAIITISLGLNEIAVRDLGLVIVLVGVFLNGPDRLCLDKRNLRKN